MVQSQEKIRRNSILKSMKDYGAGIRQLSRLTGVSYGVIQKLVQQGKSDHRTPDYRVGELASGMAEAEDVGAASRPFSYRFVTFNGESEYVCRIIRIFAPTEQ
jgi:hypothetical protein